MWWEGIFKISAEADRIRRKVEGGGKGDSTLGERLLARARNFEDLGNNNGG